MNELEHLVRDTLVARDPDAPDDARLLGDVRARMASRRRRLWVGTALVAATTAGVLIVVTVAVRATSEDSATPESTVTVPSNPTVTPSEPSAGPGAGGVLGGDPARLVGKWTVTGTPDGEPSALTFDRTEITITWSCGNLSAGWRASWSGLFVADVVSWSPRCNRDPAQAWLTTATSFAIGADGVRLVDADGRAVATLVASEERPSNGGPDAGPPVTAGVVPESLVPASPGSLLGRWIPLETETPGEAPTQPFAEFAADGGWTGSDGCNGQGGRWVANDQGELLATLGIQTLIGCQDMRDVGGWVHAAAAAGFDGDVLVLLDPGGEEIARMRRE